MVPTGLPFRKIDHSQYESHPFLQRQLVAYIGNKRALLPFLGGVFDGLHSRHPVRTFLDPFAGSGAVSRLAKLMGFEVAANDWEFYSWVMNCSHLVGSPERISSMFGRHGGLTRALMSLNSERDSAVEGYISRYFAPQETSTADYRTERLFYTRENALFLDRVRSRIEEWYPGWELDEQSLLEKAILVSSVIYEAATHANTSGVFKAYHKGFGGHSGDALGRILSPMRLEYPELIDASTSCTASCEDAVTFVSGRSADLVYLDPPYNSHQYGSNYFMLNSVARWDQPEAPLDRTETGRLRQKAGIRADWADTRSAYCSRKTAAPEFARLLDRIDSRYIALSYSTDGIIEFDELVELLAAHGEPEVIGRDYTKYRGGKQSLHRRNANTEFVLIVERSARRSSHIGGGTGTRSSDPDRFIRFRLASRIHARLKGSFEPGRLVRAFEFAGSSLILSQTGEREHETVGMTDASVVMLPTVAQYRIGPLDSPIRSELEDLLVHAPIETLQSIDRRLGSAACTDNLEEAQVVLRLLRSHDTFSSSNQSSQKVLSRRLLQLIRKFANRKYQTEFADFMRVVREAIEQDHARLGDLEEGLARLESLFLKRIDG